MALPVTISNVALAVNGHNGGPYKSSGGAFYVILLDSADLTQIEAHKATDPTVSFTATGTNPDVGATNVGTLSSFQDGDNIHVVTKAGTVLHYHVFSMSSDSWTVSAASILTTATTASEQVDICVRSDGDVIVCYQGLVETIMAVNYNRVYYARREASSWTVNVRYDNLGKVERDITVPALVQGDQTNDRTHLFYLDASFTSWRMSTLLNNNTFGQRDALVDATLAGYAPGFGTNYNDGGTRRVRSPYHRGTPRITEFDDANAPSITTASVSGAGGQAWSFVRANGTDQHYLWIQGSSDDLYRDVNTGSGWGTDTLVETITDTNPEFTCNIYTRTSAKIAYVWDDGGTVKYNEVDLGGGATPVSASATGIGLGAVIRSPSLAKKATGIGVSGVIKQTNKSTMQSIGIGVSGKTLTANKTMANTQGIGVAGVTIQNVFTQIAAAIGIGIATVQRQGNLAIGSIGIGVVNVTRQMSLSLSAIGIGLANVTREIRKTLAGTSIGVAAVAISRTMTLAAIGIGIATVNVTKTATVLAAAIGIGVGNLTRQINKILSGIGIGIAAVTIANAFSVVAAAIGIGVASLQRQISKTLNGVGIGVATVVLVRTAIIVAAAIAVGVAAMSEFVMEYRKKFLGEAGLWRYGHLKKHWKRRKPNWKPRKE